MSLMSAIIFPQVKRKLEKNLPTGDKMKQAIFDINYIAGNFRTRIINDKNIQVASEVNKVSEFSDLSDLLMQRAKDKSGIKDIDAMTIDLNFDKKTSATTVYFRDYQNNTGKQLIDSLF